MEFAPMMSTYPLRMRPSRRVWLALSLAVLMLAPACNDSGEDDTEFDDPFAYCHAIQDADAPDARYTGEAVPASIEEGIRAAAGIAADAPAELIKSGTSWRCMGGEVYACFVGANLPCEAKADVSEDPSTEMSEFCAANPGAETIPAAVTGRETVFAWTCEGANPVVEQQVFQVDERGFLAEIWYRLESS
jgi:hypothetical protein